MNFDAITHESVLSDSNQFLEEIYERSNAFACNTDNGKLVCKCNTAANYGEACDKNCIKDSKENEVASDFSKCVCPGTNAGASFKDDKCDVCSDKYYPKNDCSKKCDDSKALFVIDDACVPCKDAEKFAGGKCVACGTNEIKTTNGLDCTCAKDTHFKVDKSCGASDVCKSGYVPKGQCTTKCTATQYVKADGLKCVDCKSAMGRIPKSDLSGCKCTAADAKVTNVTADKEDCSCLAASKFYGSGAAYK